MKTWVDVVHARASSLGEKPWVKYLVDGDCDGRVVELTFAELLRRAQAIGATLQAHAGERAVLLYPSGVDFLTAFFGCHFAGVIPVPAYPPDPAKPERALAKLRGILESSGATLALTTAEHLPLLQAVVQDLRCLSTDDIAADRAGAWRPPPISSSSIALLQYTSGSTGAPKGAVVEHRHLLANSASIDAQMGPCGDVVGWLPVFHDMGLIGNVLQTLFIGSTLVLLSPIAFLKRPARWLEAISRFRATTSGAPNFAYDLCVRRVTDTSGLDLSSWRVAFCGAEPVRIATLDRFAAAFAPCGFRRDAIYPCYGLAEATLFVTGKDRGTSPKTTQHDGQTLVSCGRPHATEQVEIVDEVDGVGEICVRGPGVVRGYWGLDDGSFGADGLLRTGDLGFLRDGELYVCGRKKDLIILAGRNLYPQDVEATVERAAPSVRAGCCAAFGVQGDDAEQLVVVAEVMRHDDDAVRAIKRALLEEHQAATRDVVLVAKGELPKTSSGKLERHACRRAYLTRSFVLASST